MSDPRPMPARQRRAALAVLLALFIAMCGQQYASAASDTDPDITVELVNPVFSSAEEINSRVTTNGGVTCWNDYVTLGGYVVHEDDELSPPTSLRLTHYYRTCDSASTPRVRSFRATRLSYAGKDGKPLYCPSFGRFQGNIGSIAGYNPPLWDEACKSGGDTILFDPADIRITESSDRGAGAAIKFVKSHWPDTIVNFPIVTIPAP